LELVALRKQKKKDLSKQINYYYKFLFKKIAKTVSTILEKLFTTSSAHPIKKIKKIKEEEESTMKENIFQYYKKYSLIT
jgi:hypothetical protein